MHLYADRLRKRRLARRYGVFYEYNGSRNPEGDKLYRVCLVDREPHKGVTIHR